MKKVLITILTFISSAGFAQNIDFQLISFNGLKFYSPKSEIVEKLGQPEKIFEPKYECGFLSAESQSTKYFTLDFKNIKFTGNHKESYLIEFINFNNDNSIILKYGKFNLNSETRLSELIEIFGKEFKETFKISVYLESF